MFRKKLQVGHDIFETNSETISVHNLTKYPFDIDILLIDSV